MPDASDVAALKERHQRLVTQEAELEGRLQQRREQHATLIEQMKEQFDCATAEELAAKIEAEKVTLRSAYETADTAITSAEQALAQAGVQ